MEVIVRFVQQENPAQSGFFLQVNTEQLFANLEDADRGTP